MMSQEFLVLDDHQHVSGGSTATSPVAQPAVPAWEETPRPGDLEAQRSRLRTQLSVESSPLVLSPQQVIMQDNGRPLWVGVLSDIGILLKLP